MNNPVSRRPEHALWPDPPGCSGWRLWKMLHDACGATKDEYLDLLDRVNLVIGAPWSLPAARLSAAALRHAMVGRTVVLLGAGVRDALGHERCPLAESYERDGSTFHQLPHPSGRSLWYNAAENRATAGRLLASLARRPAI